MGIIMLKNLCAASCALLFATQATAAPAVVFIVLGQSNGTVNDTNGLQPPTATTPTSLYGPPYASTFTASFSPTPLPAKTFWTLYPAISTRSPSPNTGTMTVSSAGLSGNVYPGEIVTCAGVNGGQPFQITSDGFGSGNNGHSGTYVVNIQASASGAACSAAEIDVGGGGGSVSGFEVYDCTTKRLEAYQPVPGATQNSYACGEGGQGSPYWGPEVGFVPYYLSAHAGVTVYLVKANVSGTGLCPFHSTKDYWDAAFAGSDLLAKANTDVQGAYTALSAAGITDYSVGGYVWIQGEYDSQDNYNVGCNARGAGGNVYYDNLLNVVNALGIKTAQNFTATGSISGDVLTVTGTPGGSIHAGELLSGPALPVIGVNASTILLPFGATCLNGAGVPTTTTGAGGAGTYCIQVEQRLTEPTVVLTDGTSGATAAASKWHMVGLSMRLDAVSGTISVGDTLSATGLLSGSYVSKAYDYPTSGGCAAPCGNIGVNVSVTGSGTYTFTAQGWGAGAGSGTGADQAPIVISEVQRSQPSGNSGNLQSDGPSLAQEAFNGMTIGSAPITTVQRWDQPLNSIHVQPAALMEEGRRIAAALGGSCDYRTATC